ncbi:sugar kinase [Paenibacillus sp. JNUCC31]|uniref:sugar kinase n=1 Tax=Paenibacillus sp. JNUCC-31 TaxID=2777983 RepID=UPI00177F4C30|nr:sugar kinase [Paenibacillus sp. JNUCC-31]QOS79799.1 sugar kinase [Paenibacillus sp. JNUCC-31]
MRLGKASKPVAAHPVAEERMTEYKLILVKRRTRLEELVVRYNTVQQAQFYIERLGADFSDYLEEDRRYHHAVQQAQQQLSPLGRVQTIDREHVPNFIFGAQDIVVVIGQDGLVANTLKYVTEQPLIGVNPDPMRWDGVLLPFTVEDLSFIIPDVIRKRRSLKEVTLAKVELNDGQYLYGVNDLFIGRKTHVSARYEVRLGSSVEQQSSSGVIVSTGMGSTGWFKSVLTGAAGVVGSEAWQLIHSDGQIFSNRGKNHFSSDVVQEKGALETKAPATISSHGGISHLNSFGWDAPYLYFTVREPFPSRTTAANLVFGQIHPKQPLRIVSQMPEDGVIFSDGVEQDFLEFNSGVEATIGLAEKRGRLVV